MKKKLCHLLFIVGILMILMITPAWADDTDVVDSGTCGDNLTWVLTEDGTLTISGTGEMEAYSQADSPWYSYRSTISSVIIENSVTSVGDYAFYYCKHLTNITIPDGVTSIGRHAFTWCTSLTSVTIPDSVTSIGDAAFSWCTSLTSISIPNSVTSIGSSVFYDCTSLTSITLPDNITSISEGFFAGCTSLTSVTIPDSVTSIGNDVFRFCTSLTSISIPDSVTSIGSSAFYSCTSLTSISIPDSVTSIGNYAFSECSNLTSISIPDSVTSIGNYAFSECSNLTSISIPDSVVSIGNYVFYNCTSLTSISIPDSVVSIGNYVFYNCTSLTSISIPGSVTSIGNQAFYNCSSLTDVYYAGSEEDWDAISISSGNSYLTSATIHYFYWSFNEDTGMLTISGSDGMDDWDVFSLEEVPWYDYLDQITSINVKDGVTYIGQSAFYNCENLEFVMLPDTLEEISAYAFYDCLSLVDVYYAGDEESWETLSANISAYGNSQLTGATIHYSCVGRLGLDSDIWNFANSDTYFFNEGYYITSSDYGKLINDLNEVDRDLVLISEYVGESILDKLATAFGKTYSRLYVDGVTLPYDPEPWDGSCYGMSAWVMLNAAGTLDASDIDSTTSLLINYNSSCVLNLVSEAADVQSAINFYQDQQYLTAAEECINEFMNYAQVEQLSLLETLAEEAAEGGNPVFIRMQWYQSYESDGVTCDTNSHAGHVIIAYGTEEPEEGNYNDTIEQYWLYTFNGGSSAYDSNIDPINDTEFSHRILIYDPAATFYAEEDEEFYLYYSDDGSWCIPGWGIISRSSASADTVYNNGQLKLVTADAEAVDLVDYNTGELSSIASGSVDSVSYITSLIDSSYSVSWDGYSADINGFSVSNNTSDATINVSVSDNITADGESTSTSSTAFLPDSDEYTVTSEEDELFFYLNTGNYLTMAATTSSGSITFQDDGGAAVSTEEEAAAYISITANDGYTDLDWYRFEVVVEETTELSAELTDDGILITGEDLSDVIINGISDDEDECITAEFSTEEDEALVTTDEEDELLILIDADNDGTCETPIDYEWYEEDDDDDDNDKQLAEDVTAALSEDEATIVISGIPEDAENITVSLSYTDSSDSDTVVTVETTYADGILTPTEELAAATTYEITITSDNYTFETLSVTTAEAPEVDDIPSDDDPDDDTSTTGKYNQTFDLEPGVDGLINGGTSDGSDSTDDSSSDTDNSDTGTSDTGSSDTGSTNSDDSNSDTGTSDNESSDTNSNNADNADTGDSDTDSSNTGSGDKESSDTGSSDTESSDTGNSDTDNSGSGNSDTASGNSDKENTENTDSGSTNSGNADTDSTDETDTFNGVRKLSDGNWYYVENDDDVIDYTGLVRNDGTYGAAGWYYVVNGKVDFSYTGLVKHDATTGGKAGWYYVKNGYVNFEKTGLVYNPGTVYGAEGWFYVKNAYVDFSFSSLVKHTDGNWYAVKNGYVNFSVTGLVKNDGTYGIAGWYYVENAVVKFNYSGLTSNTYGSWYVKNGYVDFSYSGPYVYNTVIFTIKNGQVVA